MILRNIKHHEGSRVGGNNINNLRYADDTVLIADSEEKLQNILTTVTVESENKGPQLNAKKTEWMVISKQSDILVCNILCKGESIKQVGIFKYLCFTITPHAKCDTEIKERIALYKDCIYLVCLHIFFENQAKGEVPPHPSCGIVVNFMFLSSNMRCRCIALELSLQFCCRFLGRQS